MPNITKSTVMSMGFSNSMIKKYLHVVKVVRSPYGGGAPPMQLYDEDDVKAFMQTAAYRAAYEKWQINRKKGKKSQESRRKNLENYYDEVATTLDIPILPFDDLREKSIYHYLERSGLEKMFPSREEEAERREMERERERSFYRMSGNIPWSVRKDSFYFDIDYYDNEDFGIEVDPELEDCEWEELDYTAPYEMFQRFFSPFANRKQTLNDKVCLDHFLMDVYLEESDPAFINRIMVNYIRHQMSDYDDWCTAIRGEEFLDLYYKDNLYYRFKQAVLVRIGSIYPQLAEECERQRKAVEEESTSPYRPYRNW